MNTLDDLRATLERHADHLQDVDRQVRAQSVRTRVRKVQQRRTGTAAAAVVVAMVLALAGAGLLRGGGTPEPAAPLFDGVPQRVEVYGFPYEVATTTALEDGGGFDLDPDGPRVVSLVASDLGTGSATLLSVSVPPLEVALARVRGNEQVSAPVEVDTGLDALQVRLDGAPDGARVGIVVYQATGALAPGVPAPGVVFREHVGDYELEDADFADADGEARVTAEMNGAHEAGVYCRSDQRDLWIHFTSSTGLEYAERCSDYDWGTNDPGINGGYLNDGTHGARTLSAYVTEGKTGERVDDAVLGLASYRQAALAEVLGEPVAPREFEFAGRTWHLSETRTMDGREETFDVDTSDGDVFFGYVVRAADSRFTWHGELDSGDMRGGGESGPGLESADWGQGGILFAGDHYEIDAELFGKDAEGAITLYRLE